VLRRQDFLKKIASEDIGGFLRSPSILIFLPRLRGRGEKGRGGGVREKRLTRITCRTAELYQDGGKGKTRGRNRSWPKSFMVDAIVVEGEEKKKGKRMAMSVLPTIASTITEGWEGERGE